MKKLTYVMQNRPVDIKLDIHILPQVDRGGFGAVNDLRYNEGILAQSAAVSSILHILRCRIDEVVLLYQGSFYHMILLFVW